MYLCCSMSFSVVVFTEESSVAVVHISWLNDGYCSWPPYKGSRLKNAVMHGEQPTEAWSRHPARMLHNYGEPSPQTSNAVDV